MRIPLPFIHEMELSNKANWGKGGREWTVMNVNNYGSHFRSLPSILG